jgi:hypothetical protein
VKLLNQVGLMLPVLRKTQACEGCGESFVCEISLGKDCWCGEVKLSEDTRQDLRAKYRKCLCRACLEKAGYDTSKPETQSERL